MSAPKEKKGSGGPMNNLDFYNIFLGRADVESKLYTLSQGELGPQKEKWYRLFLLKEKILESAIFFIQGNINRDLEPAGVKIPLNTGKKKDHHGSDDHHGDGHHSDHGGHGGGHHHPPEHQPLAGDYESLDEALTALVIEGKETEIKRLWAVFEKCADTAKAASGLEKQFKTVMQKAGGEDGLKKQLELLNNASRGKLRWMLDTATFGFLPGNRRRKEALSELKINKADVPKKLESVQSAVDALEQFKVIKDRLKEMKIEIFKTGEANITVMAKVREAINHKMQELWEPGQPDLKKPHEAYALYLRIQELKGLYDGKIDYGSIMADEESIKIDAQTRIAKEADKHADDVPEGKPPESYLVDKLNKIIADRPVVRGLVVEYLEKKVSAISDLKKQMLVLSVLEKMKKTK